MTLAPQEKRCILYLLEGKTAKETARKLSLSPRTIEHYLDNIRQKVGVRRKIDLITVFEKMLFEIMETRPSKFKSPYSTARTRSKVLDVY